MVAVFTVQKITSYWKHTFWPRKKIGESSCLYIHVNICKILNSPCSTITSAKYILFFLLLPVLFWHNLPCLFPPQYLTTFPHCDLLPQVAPQWTLTEIPTPYSLCTVSAEGTSSWQIAPFRTPCDIINTKITSCDLTDTSHSLNYTFIIRTGLKFVFRNSSSICNITDNRPQVQCLKWRHRHEI